MFINLVIWFKYGIIMLVDVYFIFLSFLCKVIHLRSLLFWKSLVSLSFTCSSIFFVIIEKLI